MTTVATVTVKEQTFDCFLVHEDEGRCAKRLRSERLQVLSKYTLDGERAQKRMRHIH